MYVYVYIHIYICMYIYIYDNKGNLYTVYLCMLRIILTILDMIMLYLI